LLPDIRFKRVSHSKGKIILPDPSSRKLDYFSPILLFCFPRLKVIIKNIAILPKIQ